MDIQNYSSLHFNRTSLPLPALKILAIILHLNMKTSFILALLPAAFALPALESRQLIYIPCAGLSGTAQCCATDVLGVANLDCANRTCFCLLEYIGIY
jgi:hypothetical protein